MVIDVLQLIIANSNYDDPDLQNLAAAGQDADAFSEYLKNVAIGGFEVKILKNEPSYKVSEEIETFFTEWVPGQSVTIVFFLSRY